MCTHAHPDLNPVRPVVPALWHQPPVAFADRTMARIPARIAAGNLLHSCITSARSSDSVVIAPDA
jgi:hypothetical protein